MLLCAMTLLPWRNVSRETFLPSIFSFHRVTYLETPRVFEDHALIGADRRWIAQIRGDPGIAKISLPAFGDFRFALRPVGFERCLPDQLCLVEIGETVVGERELECNKIVDFSFAQRKALHPTVEKWIWNAALVVMVHHVPKRGERAIVHIGPGDSDIAERLALEGTDVAWVFGHQEPAEFGIGCLQREFVDLLRVAGLQDGERLAGELREVLLVRGDPDIVKLLVGEERRHRVERVAGAAAPLALE